MQISDLLYSLKFFLTRILANMFPHGQESTWGKVIRGEGIVILASWKKHFIRVYENLSQYPRILNPLTRVKFFSKWCIFQTSIKGALLRRPWSLKPLILRFKGGGAAWYCLLARHNNGCNLLFCWQIQSFQNQESCIYILI